MEKASGTEAFTRRFNKKVQDIEQILNAEPQVRASQQKQLEFLKAQYANVVAFLSTVEDVGMHESLVRPLVHSISELKVEVEDTYKQDKTPAEAFLGKCKYTSTPVIDILQKLEIKKADPRDLDLLNIDFNLLGVSPNNLKPKAFELFDRIAPEKVRRDTIRVFIDEVARGYRINPYHNFTHGFSVCQVFYFMWSVSPRLQKFLDVDEMYIGCVASFSHDIAHPGRNNLFHANSNHYFARFTLGKSILEHIHAFKTLEIFKRKANMLECYDKGKAADHRKGLIEAILATDMTFHASSIESFKNNREKYLNEDTSITGHSNALRGLLVHGADLNNPCLEIHNYLNWAALLTQEFHDQTTAEKAVGLEPTGMLIYKGEVGFYHGQKFFSNVLCLPLFDAVQEVFPEINFGDRVRKNIKYIEDKIQQLTAPPSTPAK